MSILVTGGAGFIGSTIARSLVQKGKDVVVFDVAPRAEALADIADRVKFVRGDLKVLPEVLNVVRDNGVQGIYHLGAMTSTASEESPWASFQTNSAGTMHVLEAARLFGVERMVFTSSAAVYGLGRTSDVATDDTIQRPTGMYGIDKLHAELIGRYYRSRFGVDFRCLRYIGIMGPGVQPQTPRGTAFLQGMVTSAALGRPFKCNVTEDTAISIMYLKDAVLATEMLFDAGKDDIKTVCYNISSVPRPVSARELEMAVKRAVPEAEIGYAPDRKLVEMIRSFNLPKTYDDSRARLEWGWKPMYSDLDELVADFIQEVRAHPQLAGAN